MGGNVVELYMRAFFDADNSLEFDDQLAKEAER